MINSVHLSEVYAIAERGTGRIIRDHKGVLAYPSEKEARRQLLARGISTSAYEVLPLHAATK